MKCLVRQRDARHPWGLPAFASASGVAVSPVQKVFALIDGFVGKVQSELRLGPARCQGAMPRKYEYVRPGARLLSRSRSRSRGKAERELEQNARAGHGAYVARARKSDSEIDITQFLILSCGRVRLLSDKH